jgi:hypothetical protein
MKHLAFISLHYAERVIRGPSLASLVLSLKAVILTCRISIATATSLFIVKAPSVISNYINAPILIVSAAKTFGSFPPELHLLPGVVGFTLELILTT